MATTDEKLDRLIEYLEKGKGKNNPIYTAVAASVIASVILWGLTQVVNAPSNINIKIENTNKKVTTIEGELKDFKKEYDYNIGNIQYNFSVLNEHNAKLVDVYREVSSTRNGVKLNNNN